MHARPCAGVSQLNRQTILADRRGDDLYGGRGLLLEQAVARGDVAAHGRSRRDPDVHAMLPLAQQQREVVASVHACGESLLRPLEFADCPAPIVAVRIWQRVKNSRACGKCCA